MTDTESTLLTSAMVLAFLALAIILRWQRRNLRRLLGERFRYRVLRPLRARLRRPRREGKYTQEEADDLWPPGSQCMYCHGWHATPGQGTCPRIKSIMFRAGGEPVRIEFFGWNEWPADQVVTPWVKQALVREE